MLLHNSQFTRHRLNRGLFITFSFTCKHNLQFSLSMAFVFIHFHFALHLPILSLCVVALNFRSVQISLNSENCLHERKNLIIMLCVVVNFHCIFSLNFIVKFKFPILIRCSTLCSCFEKMCLTFNSIKIDDSIFTKSQPFHRCRILCVCECVCEYKM